MKTEILPCESDRAEAFGLWMSSPMPMVTLVKTMDVSRLAEAAKKRGMKFTMLMCWCIGRAANGIEAFYTLSEGGKLRLEEGVTQVCRDLYLPDGNGGMAKQSLGSWGATASGAAHKNDTYFAGTGQLIVTGDDNGCLLIFR